MKYYFLNIAREAVLFPGKSEPRLKRLAYVFFILFCAVIPFFLTPLKESAAATGRIPADRVYNNEDEDEDEEEDQEEEEDETEILPPRGKVPPRKQNPEKIPPKQPFPDTFSPEHRSPEGRPPGNRPQERPPQPSPPERSAQQPLPLERIGRLLISDDSMCTAALVGPAWILTAAHCLFGDDNKPSPARHFVRFNAAGNPATRVAVRSEVRIGSRFDAASFLSRSDIDGEDWALLRLAEPIGCAVGWFPVTVLSAAQKSALMSRSSRESFSFVSVLGKSRIYSGCKIISTWPDHTYAHLCGSREGDSGSPDLWHSPEGWSIIGLESAEADLPHQKGADLAVGSASFAEAVQQITTSPRCP